MLKLQTYLETAQKYIEAGIYTAKDALVVLDNIKKLISEDHSINYNDPNQLTIPFPTEE